MIFGKDSEGSRAGWLEPEGVTIGEEGYTLDDVLVHDAAAKDSTLQLKLALMDTGDGLPVALGVIRNVDAPSYDGDYQQQIKRYNRNRRKNHSPSFSQFLNVWK